MYLALVAYMIAPLFPGLVFRRPTSSLFVASLINVPLICIRLVWLETTLGRPPDFDIIFGLSILLWSAATIVYNCVVCFLLIPVLRLITKGVRSFRNASTG